jgi:small-conductance mechanosensitive channel
MVAVGAVATAGKGKSQLKNSPDWSQRSMTLYSINRWVLRPAIMGGVILIGGRVVYAQTPAPQASVPQTPVPPAKIPVAKDALQYLRETIDWYRHLRLQEQMAIDGSDLSFLDDNRQIAKQIVQLSFDFVRAEAKRAAKQAVPSEETEQASQSAGYSGLAKATAAADQEVRDTEAEIESLKQKLQAAQGEKRRELQSTLDEVQAELGLARTRRDTFRSILQFVQAPGTAGTNVETEIDELQRSVPELQAEASRTAGAQAAATLTPSPPIVQPVNRNQPGGILDLVTSLFALSRKTHTLDDAITETNALSSASQQIRRPLIQSMEAMAQRGEELAKEADTSGPAQLTQQKRELDGLTNSFKDVSAVAVPLARQSILFGIYTNSVNRWKANIQSQYSVELRSLILRAIVLGAALAVVFILGEVWRKATLRYVRDIRRRYQFLLIRRIVLWCAVGITVAFALATEIGSLATFAGLITAGIAVALQNVILAIAGYFFLVGKYGVRVGDRVQISGVTGSVVDVGLIRLHLMELAGPGNPTGRVVVFSNSIVFQPTASFFKQIPGTNFGWHEVTLILSPDTDYQLAEKRILGAVESVYANYHDRIEEQHRQVEKTFALGLDMPQPKSRLRLTQTGLEVVIRYPLELERSAEIDDQIIRQLLTALERPPKLKLVGSGTPNIQPVVDGTTAA